MHFTASVPFLLGSLASAAVIGQRDDIGDTTQDLEKRVNFPFNRVVAFGDSFTDNGNGSYAHCVQAGVGDCNNKIYGHKTWTNGPVAVSYLVDMLGVPLAQDFAWGWARGAGGGNKSAATIKQSFDECPYVKDGFQQVKNYSSFPGHKRKIADTLHFLWIGNLDIIFPKFQYPDASTWANEMASMISDLVGELIDQGAPYVMVPSLYPKHISPAHAFMASQAEQQKNMGIAIAQSNGIIKAALQKKFGNKVIWYDAYGRMMNIWRNAKSFGFTQTVGHQCDGGSNQPADWQSCIVNGHGDEFYWVNYTDPTTAVHYLIAQGMYAMLKKRFA